MTKSARIAILSIVLSLFLAEFAGASQIDYIVRPGDTLWGIAQENGLTLEELKQFNNLQTDCIYPGDHLIVAYAALDSQPADSSDLSDTYTVQPGDCLNAIAANFSISVEAIREINHLNSDFIKAGDRLIVVADKEKNIKENSTEQSRGEYTVKAGDCLSSIAASHGITTEWLKSINNKNSNLIYPGEILTIYLPPAADVSRGGAVLDGQRILAAAEQYLGTPYRYGGRDPNGFDCSGFVCYIFSRLGHNMPRTALSQYGEGIWVGKNELQTGDLVFFACYSSSIDHVGIYAGNNRFIHSSSPRSGGVIYSSLGESFYARTYVGARRIIR